MPPCGHPPYNFGQIRKIYSLIVPFPHAPMSLCSFCVKSCHDMEFLPGMHGSIVHHPSIVSLLQSAATCPLCKLFVSWIDEKRMNVNVADAKERRWTRSI